MAKLTKKNLANFPTVLFVARKGDKDEEWLQADKVAAALIEDDGPEIVAHYILNGLYRLQKTVRTIDSVDAPKRRK